MAEVPEPLRSRGEWFGSPAKSLEIAVGECIFLYRLTSGGGAVVAVAIPTGVREQHRLHLDGLSRRRRLKQEALPQRGMYHPYCAYLVFPGGQTKLWAGLSAALWDGGDPVPDKDWCSDDPASYIRVTASSVAVYLGGAKVLSDPEVIAAMPAEVAATLRRAGNVRR